jgi:hypothetical protein
MDLSNLFKPFVWLEKFARTYSYSKTLPTLDGSAETRAWVAARLFYQDSTQKTDILNPEKTQTQLISMLEALIKKNYWITITALTTDHHDDSGLGEPPLYCGTHAKGWAADLWINNTAKSGDWVDQSTHLFRQFLVDVSNCEFHFQTGLTSDCYNAANIEAAGSGCYLDDGGSHIHISAKNE